MIRLDLRRRLLLLSLLPSGLLAVILVAYFVFSGMQTLEEELRERGNATVLYLAPASEYGIIAGHLESLQTLAQTTIQQPNVKAAVVVGRPGQILAVSGRVSLSSSQLKTFGSGPGLVADGEEWAAFGAPVLRSLAEADELFDPSGVRKKPEIIGQVFVEFDKSQFHERRRQLVLHGALIIAVGLLLAVGSAVSLTRSLVRPVNRLVQGVRAMARGEYDTRVETAAAGEFGELERGFNDMAARIADVHRTMQERIEEATAQLAFQARHDSLTGLVNRREFEARLQNAFSATQAGAEEGSLLILDLDRFKQVNDTCGHLAGDELLRQLTRLFQGRLRNEDTLARIGGDEFAVLLDRCSGPRALQVGQDLCGLATAFRFIWQGRVFSIGVSIGLAPISRDARTINDIIALADAACYTAKESGGNRVHVQSARQLPDRRSDEHSWPDRIAAALAEKRLFCDALPLRGLQAGGEAENIAEIGVRLDKSIPMAGPAPSSWSSSGRSDLGPAIDSLVLEKTVACLARVAAQGRRVRCLVPLSTTSVGDPLLTEGLEAVLKTYPAASDGLYLVIPEVCAVQQTERTEEFCLQARNLGYRIALGEFGGGLASFRHVHALRPDCLLISRSLTRGIENDGGAHALLRAIQEVCGDLNMESIATGVDDLADLQLLKALGITYAQGFAVAPSEPFEDWIEGAVIRGT